MSVTSKAKTAVKSVVSPDSTTLKVFGGLVLFGFVVTAIRMIPDTVPAAGVVKKVANAATGG